MSVLQSGERLVLGLDLGTSSVGWALFRAVGDDVVGLVDLGVRHFEEVVEPKGGQLKNAARRQARGMRRNLRRRRQRRDQLIEVLREAGLLGNTENPFSESGNDPYRAYRLRALAVDCPLSPEELGRALFHLGRRRGFKSNRGARMASLLGDPEVQALLRADEAKGDGDGKRDDEGPVLLEIAGLRARMAGRTLGEHFWDKIQIGESVRGIHTDRSMYEEEFERIWDVQKKFHPTLLTDEVRARVHRAIFFQRPLKAVKSRKGPCSLEPTKQRADRAQLISQRFRYWQDLCNLVLTDSSTGERRPLSLEEKRSLAEQLERTATMSWGGVRKHLRLKSNWTFNLERAKGGELKGNSTAVRISARAKELWDTLPEPERDRLVEILTTVDDRGTLYRTLLSAFALDPTTAYRLAVLELEGGVAGLSSKAMRKMLPRMMAGATRSEAQEAAGFTPWTDVIERRPRLEILEPESLPNPRVRKALGQVRKVVNALIAAYGQPEVIRIELARDLSLTQKEKGDRERANKLLANENRQADEWFACQGVKNPTRADRFWYRLAKQCGWRCPYTGRPIPQELGSMSQFQIEHIVPFVRSLDDSYNNLTLCETETNRRKGNRTPFEAFGATADWEGILARVAEFRGPGSNHKRRLFGQTELPDEEKMASRQLNETRDICRKAAAYLRPVCGEVQVTKGSATAMLREHWGLMETLHGRTEKTRDDLRHHAIDAVAIAFTSRSLFMRVTLHRKRMTQSGEVDLKVMPLSNAVVPPAPAWLNAALRERLATVVVSHEATRGIRDAFHEETALGLRNPVGGKYQTRKPLTSLSATEIEAIVDPGLREAVRVAYEASGKKADVAFTNGLRHGTYVAYRARIEKTLPNAEMLRTDRGFFAQKNSHHVAIFEHEASGKRRLVAVSTLEAARRARRLSKSIVDASPPEEGWRFVMWLAKNDTLLVEGDRGGFFKLTSIWSASGTLEFRAVNSANNSDKESRLFAKATTLRARKVSIDPIGRVRVVPEGVV